MKAIRLSGKALAQASGLDEDTISRVFGGRTDPLNSTLERIERAVAAEEVRLAAHLAALHPEHAA
jgi:transcriptional regulator with XRE-family HTH domain